MRLGGAPYIPVTAAADTTQATTTLTNLLKVSQISDLIFDASSCTVVIANPTASAQTITAATLTFTDTVGGNTVTISYALTGVSIVAGATQVFSVALGNGVLANLGMTITFAGNPTASTLSFLFSFSKVVTGGSGGGAGGGSGSGGSTATSTSLSAVTATGPGASVKLPATRSNWTIQLVVTGAPTAIDVSFQISENGSNWVTPNLPHLTQPTGSAVSAAMTITQVPSLYYRLNVNTLTGGTAPTITDYTVAT